MVEGLGQSKGLASRECQANPDRDTVYTRVPATYRVEHSLDASGVVCRSHFCHAKVGLRGAPRQIGRPVGWRKHTSAAAEVVVGTITKAEHVRQKPAIVTEVFEVKASRCAALHFPPLPLPTRICMPAPPLRVRCQPLVAGSIASTASGDNHS